MPEQLAGSSFTNILSTGIQQIWKIEAVLATITEDSPRTITEKELKTLRQGLRERGFLIPVLINSRTNQLVSGKNRIVAAQLEEIQEVPVVLLDLSEADEVQLSLALNKIEGEWDYALLEEHLERLAEVDRLALSGFSEADMVEIFSQQDVDGYDEDFTDFAERMISTSTTLPVVKFRSPKIQFVCSRARYDALVSHIYAQVGLNDSLATAWFFQIIGLSKADAITGDTNN